MVGDLKLIGLTGGIGAGKSTVARMIADRKVPVIDADQLAREVVEPGTPAHAEIAAAWPQVIDASAGGIDRRRLAAVVFADPSARARLEAMTHPRIQQHVADRAAALARDGHRIAFYEAALLVETGFHRGLDGLVVVVAPEEIRIARVVARDGCTPAEARARMAAQASPRDQQQAATHRVDNGADLAATRRRVDEILADLLST